jgi:hypothetical protein
MHWLRQASKAGSFLVPFNAGSTSLAEAADVAERQAPPAAAATSPDAAVDRNACLDCIVYDDDDDDDDDDSSTIRLSLWVVAEVL